MKKWILSATIASSLALGQVAVAEQRNHHNAGHDGRHDNRGHAQHNSRQQHNRYDRVVIGGSFQNVHDKGHSRRHDRHNAHDYGSRGHRGHRRDRHVHDRHCGHNRSHDRRHRGYSHYDDYGHGYRNHSRRNDYDGRHHYKRSERRISHVIRAY